MNKLFFLLISMTFLLFSCQDIEYKKNILGDWKCIDWTIKGESSLPPNAIVQFNFAEDGQYEYQNQGLKEKGSYKVQGGKLYTTPENELEMAVDIEKLTTDTLIFNMSRGGRPETMLLVRN